MRRRHSRLRRFLEWAGWAACIAIVIVWAVSPLYALRFSRAGYEFGAIDGRVYYAWYNGKLAAMRARRYRAPQDKYRNIASFGDWMIRLRVRQTSPRLERRYKSRSVASLGDWMVRRVRQTSPRLPEPRLSTWAKYRMRLGLVKPSILRFWGGRPSYRSGFHGRTTLVLPCWLLFVASAIPNLIVRYRVASAIPNLIVWYRDRRRPPGHCQSCGYDLTGNESGVCPECGTKIET